MILDRFSWHGQMLMLDRKFTGYTVVPDKEWPKMFRVHAPDGTVSDMVNLTRAKDAARSMADRELLPR